MAISWVDPYTKRYATPPDKLTAACEAWMVGNPKTQITRIAGLTHDRVKAIVAANFQIEWVDDGWVNLETEVELAHPENHIQISCSRSRLTRDPLNGATLQPQPRQLVHCKLCKVDWLSGETGCFHRSDRMRRIAHAVFGDEYRPPNPEDIPRPLNKDESSYFRTSLLRLLDERCRDVHILLDTLKNPTGSITVNPTLNRETATFLRARAALSGRTPEAEMQAMLDEAIEWARTGKGPAA